MSSADNNCVPSKILLHRRSQTLELEFYGSTYELPAVFLRVHSPSAEVQGHGPGQKNLPLDKESVQIIGIEAQGNYAIKLIFSDGHDSGIFTWPYLYELSSKQNEYWQAYLEEAEVERNKRNGESAIKWVE